MKDEYTDEYKQKEKAYIKAGFRKVRTTYQNGVKKIFYYKS